MADVTRIQRERIAELMSKDADLNGLLDPAERQELTSLQVLAGIAPDAPISLVRRWARGELGASIPNSMQRSMRGMTISQRSSMTPRQREVELLGNRWPKPRLTGRQAVVELYRIRDDWSKTPKQRAVERMRRSV
jgi:hypothetical protein